jgi:hypothetical protein
MRACAAIVAGALELLAGCGDNLKPWPKFAFEMFYGGRFDDRSFLAAWRAAAQDPAAGINYGLRVIAYSLRVGTVVTLVSGRTTTGSIFPEVIDGQAQIADERLLATSAVAEDGLATFPPLAVVPGDQWVENSGAIPVELLCGVAVVAARAFEDGERIASTWFVVDPGCSPDAGVSSHM